MLLIMHNNLAFAKSEVQTLHLKVRLVKNDLTTPDAIFGCKSTILWSGMRVR